MYKETWKNYKESFNFILPFILVKVAFEIIVFILTENMVFDKFSFIGQERILTGNFGVNSGIVAKYAIQITFNLFIVSLFEVFLIVIMKAFLNKDTINYKEKFKESLGFYLRYLGLSIIIYAIILGVTLLGIFAFIVPFIALLTIGLALYFEIVLMPCKSYLVYHDTTPEIALEKGKEIGKKYLWKILLFILVIGIIGALVDVYENINIYIYSLYDFVKVNAEIFLIMFMLTICKKEDKKEEIVVEEY
ncbi:hypothetical protein DP145_05460 [Clostridium tetani]|uniref:hypothetical protein n=1 Tax=Clostridium tetani TaxID=1513 RepID=UPI00100BFA52|nr:hypothetical protein [Clostridium tetani]RXI46995.1 hypothetical protein DP126_04795 [Clostridium tetani]RXI69048.1 hypothetical protein DP127_12045 [Clostridium tetani]RXM60898.1 hypothetical protein DP138_07215 [Clostridium tetani]RXM68629.1 hypothetical protein DP145_05460 [Clostridium tetani]